MTGFLTVRNLAWLAIYGVLVAALVWGMHRARQRVIATLQNPTAQAEWETWVKEATRQAKGEGPVERRVPRSSAPPALVLLQDHFAVCVAGAILITSALFVTMMLMLRGVLAQPAPRIDLAPDQHADQPPNTRK